MLLDIREKVRNSKPIKYTLITLICIPFALVGIGSYFSGGQVPTVAEVDGVEINQQQLDQAYNQQRQRLAQMFGGELPPGFDNEELLRNQALEQLVEQQVVRSEVERERFAVGDATLGREIRQLPVFQVDGRFDNETYRSQIRAMGSSVPAFEQQFRDDTALSQFRNGIAGTSFRLPAESERIDALTRQERTLDTLRFDLEQAKAGIEPDEAEVEAWFDERADDYQFPERVKLAWLELDRAKLAESVDVSDDEARTYYDENRARYVKPPVRSASHILINLDDDASDSDVAAAREKLNSLRQQVQDGADFAELAKANSEDVGSADAGGDLGAITPGTMVPAFEEALDELNEVGDLSEPVRSEFGMHLIRLNDITEESGESFAEAKDSIIKTLKADQADREFAELREQLLELTFDNPESLEVAADETGLTIQRSDWVDRTTEGDTLATDPQVLQAALSPDVKDDGNNSDVIELADGRAVVVRVREYEGPRPQTLDDVRDEVVDAIRTERAGEQLDEAVEAARTQLEAGESVTDLAADNELASAETGLVLTRGSTDFSQQVIADIYARPRPADAAEPVTGSAELANGDRLLYRLEKVETPPAADSADAGGDETADDQAVDATDGTAGGETDSEADSEVAVQPVDGPEGGAAGDVAAPQLGNIEFDALVGSLRERTDVEISP